MEKKRKDRLTWEGWSFLPEKNSRFEGKCPRIEQKVLQEKEEKEHHYSP